MKFKVKSHAIERVRNIQGKVISCRYEYYIMKRRWYRRPLYLRLLPGWQQALENNKPCNIQLSTVWHDATTFTDKAMADTVAYFIQHRPDDYIQ